MEDAPLSLVSIPDENDEEKVQEDTEILSEIATYYDPNAPKLLMLGAGHISQEVAKLAHYAGFTVDIMDMREEYLVKENFPKVRELLLCENYANIQDTYEITSKHFVAIVTHSFETDVSALRHVLHSNACYIGMAGTARKKENIFQLLRDEGFPDTELACICCPIGIDIGSENAAEMAISTVAELIAARAGKLMRPIQKFKR